MKSLQEIMDEYQREQDADPEDLRPYMQWPPPERTNTFEGWRNERIAAGRCPHSWCLSKLVDGHCPKCGWDPSTDAPLSPADPHPEPE